MVSCVKQMGLDIGSRLTVEYNNGGSATASATVDGTMEITWASSTVTPE